MNNVLPLKKPQSETWRLFVRDLDVVCSIGILPFEKTTPQRVRVNLTCETVLTPVAGDINSVVCYDRLVTAIQSFVQNQHVDLVETVAEHICHICFEDSRVQKVWARVEKLDIYDNAAGVGVELERVRS